MSGDGVGVGPSALYEALRAEVAARHPTADLVDLHDLAVLAADGHDGEFRRSGDPYVTHPFVVATYVAQWGCSLECVQAALLHDLPDSGVDLRPLASDRVVALVELLHRCERDGRAALDGCEAATVADVMMLKLADRLHNARTWPWVPPAKARRKARETIDHLVPVAAELGLREVGAELDHLARAELASSRTRPAPPRSEVTGGGLTSSTIMQWVLLRLPERERARYAAEWQADLGFLRNRRERWLFVLGIVWSARRLR